MVFVFMFFALGDWIVSTLPFIEEYIPKNIAYAQVNCSTACSAITEISQPECNALCDLYNSTNGNNRTNTVANNRPWFTNNLPCDGQNGFANSWY